jgi:hypothetical protein
MLGYLFQILGVKFVYYSGALPKQKQDHAMNAFQNDPKTMVMVRIRVILRSCLQ